MPLNRIVVWTANAALAVLCCWLGAGILASISGEVLAPEVPDSFVAAAAAPGPDRTWQTRQAILDRNLFNARLLGEETEPVTEDLAATKLPLKLLGTAAAADDRQSWAAVEDQEKRQHLVVRVADRLQGKAEVVRIERGRIVLRNGGRLEELALADENGPGIVGAGGALRTSAAQSADARGRKYGRPERRAAMEATRNEARGNSPVERVQRLAEDRFGVSRDDVQSVASNPAALFSQARILPKYQDGKMMGVQLNAIQSGSLFEQIGIVDGDTITELNGIQITSQQESAAVLRQLTESTEFSVTVTGADGQQRRLTYEVH
jgi:general secretion pathway protein C